METFHSMLVLFKFFYLTFGTKSLLTGLTYIMQVNGRTNFFQSIDYIPSYFQSPALQLMYLYIQQVLLVFVIHCNNLLHIKMFQLILHLFPWVS